MRSLLRQHALRCSRPRLCPEPCVEVRLQPNSAHPPGCSWTVGHPGVSPVLAALYHGCCDWTGRLDGWTPARRFCPGGTWAVALDETEWKVAERLAEPLAAGSWRSQRSSLTGTATWR